MRWLLVAGGGGALLSALPFLLEPYYLGLVVKMLIFALFLPAKNINNPYDDRPNLA